VVAVLHDLDLVRNEFPETLMLARDCLGWGPTAEVLTAANRLRARTMAEGWSADAEECGRATTAAAA
jgi:zinc/manganese transport system ATP-binding protein